MLNKLFGGITTTVAMVTIGYLVFVVGLNVKHGLTEHKLVVIKVEEKEIQSHSKSSTKLIFAENGNVYSVNDSILNNNYHSMDTYSSLKKGSCYAVEVHGFRSNFPTQYENILSATKEVCNGEAG